MSTNMEKIYPLTPMQEGMYYHKQLSDESTEYFIQNTVKVSGKFRNQIVLQSLSMLVEKHEVLRTAVTFPRKSNHPWQVILKNRKIEVTEIDLSELDSDSYVAKIKEIKANDLKRGFNLEKDSLLRIALIKRSEEEHLMIWSFHHIIMDGWCLSIIFNDFLRYYKLIMDGESQSSIQFKLEREKAQSSTFSDYVQWLAKQDKEEGLAYWKGMLEGYETIAEIKETIPEKEIQAKSEKKFEFTTELSDKISRFAQKNSTTVNNLAEIAIGILLGKYCRSKDVVFGKVVSGRNVPVNGIEKTVGLFINTVPTRITFGEQDTVEEMIQNNMRQLAESSDYSYCSLSEIQSQTSLGSDLIKVLFVFENYFVEKIEDDIKELDFEIGEVREQTNYALSISFALGKALNLRILYDSSIYTEEDIVTFIARLTKLLDALTDDSSKKLEDINILDDSEYEKILHDFNDTAVEYQKEKTVVELFEEQVESTPENIAVIYENERITYRELNEKANQVAYKLRSLGVGPEEKVAIVAERSLEMMIGIYGIIKAGGAYVPVAPEYPEERVRYMLEDSEPKAILLAKTKLPFTTEIPLVDLEEPDLYMGEAKNPERVNTPNDLMYVIYTSGTTGKPKGVMVEHRGIVNLKGYFEHTCGIVPEDRVLQFATFTFDTSVWEMTMTILNGAALAIVSSSKRMEIDEMISYLEREEISVATLPPQYAAQINLGEMKNLRIIVTAGSEALHEVIKRLKPTQKFINSYGPTENTICATHWEYKKGMDIPAKIPIGKPLRNEKLYILSSNNSLCGIGMPGELCVTGVGVTRGYMNRPELTAEKFIENPFGEGRLYRTGDLARWLPDGNIEYLGRIDEQVKIRGFRIELGEIESVIRNIEYIKDVAIIVKEDEAKMKAICAFLVSDNEINMASVREEIQKYLPDYMVPTYMTQIEKLPFTQNGKLDKKALLKIDLAYMNDYLAPRNEIERKLAKAFEEILGIEQVGIQDNFFEIGGDSIKAIRIVSKMRECGYSVNVKDIIQLQRIDGISEKVNTLNKNIQYGQDKVSGNVPFTPIQKDFIDWKFVEPNYFNQATFLQSRDRIDIEALTETLKALVIHHDALRMVRRDQKLYIREVEEGKLFTLEQYDYRQDDSQQLRARIEEDCNRIQGSMDLFNGPLVKAALFQTKEADHLMVCIHHMVVDGVSWQIILKDMEDAYQQYINTKKIQLPRKTASYKDWALALSVYGESSKLKKEEEYWQGVVKQMPLGILADFGDANTSEIRTITFEFNKEDTTQLIFHANKAYGTEVKDLLLCALGMAVNEVTGQKIITIEMEGHGREEISVPIEVDRTVGWFTSIYPVIMKVKDGLDENIIEAKETLRQIPNNGIGYGIIKQRDGMVSEVDKNCIGFNYLGEVDAVLKGDSSFVPSPFSKGNDISEKNRFINSLSINGVVVNGILKFILQFSSSKYSDTFIEHLCSAYSKVLKTIIWHCVNQKITIKTPSDYNMPHLKQETLDKILQQYPDIEKIYGLTPMQEGIYYHKLLNQDSAEYVVQNCVKVNGMLERECCLKSLNLLAEQHDVLRTAIAFPTGSQQPYQLVLKERKIEVKEYDLSGLDSQSYEKKVQEMKEDDVQRGFNFEEDSLLRVAIIKRDVNEYLMLWTFHHIIMDGWCISVLFNDYLKGYKQLQNGLAKSDTVFELQEHTGITASFSEYVNWINDQGKEEGIAYWRNLLEGYDTVADMQESAYESEVCAVSEKRHEFSETLSRQISDFAQKHKSTISNLAEIAVGMLISKYCGSKDVVFGKVVSGRNIPIEGIERTVGLFINTIPIRVTVEEEETIANLVQNNMRQSAESSEYDYCSLSEIQGQVQVGSDLIKILFVYENYYVEKAGQGVKDLSFEMEEVREQTNYALSISFSFNEVLRLRILYDSAIYTNEDIERYSNQLGIILDTLTKEESVKVSDVEVLSQEEREKVLYTFNDSEMEYSKDKTVVELFEEQVERAPDKIAVEYEEEKLTYEELNKKANEVAVQLREAGVKSEDRVVILAERSLEMIIGIVAIIKSGAAFVPVDKDYPEERIRYIFEDSKPKAVLLAKAGLPATVKTICPVIHLDNQELYQKNVSNLEKINTPNNLLYVIYTSGTTGRPKGVMVENQGITNLAAFYTKNGIVDSSSKVAQFFNMVFDGSVWDITMALLTGATLTLVSSTNINDVFKMQQYLQEKEITTITLPPQYAIQMDFTKLKTLKMLITAGSEAKKEICSMTQSDTEFMNAYGPTEGTICATYWRYSKNQSIQNRIPIGKPVPNVKIFIQDGENLCGIGMPGELCIAGAGVARGYLNRPELTEEKFVDNPYGEGKMYRSGDLAKWLPDGNLEYLGRIDEQVKIRGFRIELGEIENVLRKTENIKDAAVIARENAEEDKEIYAYFVSDKRIPVEEIKEELGKELPYYMVPARIKQIDKIPVTVNGKLDKRVLPEIEFEEGQQYLAPRNDMEKKLCGVFSNILGIEKVGIQNNFFALGGHSLRAIRAINQIEAKTGVRLPLKAIFETPTVEGIAELIEQEGAEKYCPIEKAEEKEFYLMSSAQKRLFMLHEIGDLGTTYNMPEAIEIEGTLNFERVQYAASELVKRHECLRTSFHLNDGEAIQRIERETDMEVEYEENAIKSTEEILSEYIRPFNLEKAPLMRMKVVKRNENRYLLLFDMHHIISDGMSVGIIINEFSRLYAQENLPELRVQYKDYSEWMQKRNLADQRAYWLKEFSGQVPVLDLPLDYPRPQIQSYRGNRVEGSLHRETKEAIQALCKRTGTTEYMVLLSATMVLLSRYSRQEDIVVGTPISGRTHKDTETMVGMFVNTLAIRGYPESEKSFHKFLQEMKEKCLGADENQEYPFEELVEEACFKRDLSRNPLFDVMFVLQNNEHATLNMEGTRIKGIESLSGVAKFDLTINVSDNGDGYAIGLEYCADLFCKENMERMLEHYLVLVEEAVRKPETKISEIRMLREEEKEKIIHEFNDTFATYPREKTIVELFEEQVERTPEKIAVVYEEESLTYLELNEKANQVAYKLRALGVKSEDKVAIVAERSLEMMIGIYGIIKSGGAYVPVDPSYPVGRIQYMLEDSEPKAVLLAKSELSFTTDIPKVNLEDASIYTGNTENPARVNTPDSLLYIIYTSGTTGKPKGVMNRHTGLINRILWMDHEYPLGNSDVILQKTTFTFDVSVWEILWWGLVGASVVLLPNGGEKDPETICHVIEKCKVTTMHFVPPMMQAFLTYLSENETEVKKLKTLKYIFASGSALQKDHEKGFMEYVKNENQNVKLINLYGPTEASIDVTCFECQGQYSQIPIGRPIWNTQIYIQNENELSGIGMPGELCIAGTQVAKGYLNLLELSNEKFVPNPYGEGKMYRTGDLARWLADGNIEYLGRIDEQVKVRGFRIELGEIESALRTITYIKDTAVIVRENSQGDKDIYAFFVSDLEADIQDIREELGKALPGYMMPQYMMQIDKIPVTQNGKLNKRALPEIMVERGNCYVSPRNELEEKLCSIFSEILGIEQIGIQDNFFELGGDSIKAIRVVSKLKEEGYRFSVKDIIQRQSAERIAASLNKASEVVRIIHDLGGTDNNLESSCSDIALEAGKYEENIHHHEMIQEYEPNILQQYYLENMSNICRCILEIEGNYEQSDLEEALQKIIQYNSTFRSFYDNKSNKIHVLSEQNWEIPCYSWAKDSTKVCELDNYYLSAEGFFPQKLLSKLLLVKLREQCYQVRIYVHHVIWDTMSDEAVKEQLNNILTHKNKELPVLDYYEWIKQKTEISQNKCVEADSSSLSNIIRCAKKAEEWRISNQLGPLARCLAYVKLDSTGIERFQKETMSFLVKLIKESIYYGYEQENEIPLSILLHGRNEKNALTVGMLLDLAFYVSKPGDDADIEIQNVIKKMSNEPYSYDFHKGKQDSNISKYISSIPSINYGGVFNANQVVTETGIIFTTSDRQQPFIKSSVLNDILYIEMSCYIDDKERIIKLISKEVERLKQ